MIVEDAVKLLLSLVPYLNAGTMTLIIDLAFERLGFKIAKREFKRKPLSSLFRGLCLVFISSVVALIIQTRLSGLEPFLIFLILFATYLALTQV
jgi:hypothetical protein